ncbi:Transposase DDE domain protein [Piscirickettsia salmonis]|uniref:Transposase DDE domain protein n=1 Tax=Piscirickettsia salmonis TaxID=1238 RepID=A0A9Q6LKD8_PISSA|nr:Transposase DDE domain protein [Piscirickettsia salmonis]QGO05748.1 Transposase DDE domain protein [Piscirickettsia salmonis]QGO34069.1 Transposase DDE domain protein [Piscirickettsia salmonis]QGO37679.1 Transposase DDE domain protein [Piscirickettsia salmonis]QGO41307.1 Transposase DDE domain protein [Piscirickettsia salmonis]
MSAIPEIAQGLTGKIIGDKGYISQDLFNRLYEKGLQLINKIRKNMKNRLMPIIDKILLRKRGIIESVFDQLKNISQIEHSRHRSVNNFMVNILAGLAAYCLQEKKPSLNIQRNLLTS